MRKALLAKLLEQIDPCMRCDLCPPFRLVIYRGFLDVELLTYDGDKEWVLLDEESRVRLIDLVDNFKLFEHTPRGLERFKVRVAQLLIREVQAGNLFKAPRAYEEMGNEEIQ